jgi:hypothetical protein
MVLRVIYQTGSYRVVDVLSGLTELVLRADASVVETTLPHGPNETKFLPDLLRAETLHVAQDIWQLGPARRQQEMNVIWHDHVGMKREVIAIAIEPQVIDDDPGQPRIEKEGLPLVRVVVIR